MPLKNFQWDKKTPRNSRGRKKKKKERERRKKKAVGLVPHLFDTTFFLKKIIKGIFVIWGTFQIFGSLEGDIDAILV